MHKIEIIETWNHHSLDVLFTFYVYIWLVFFILHCCLIGLQSLHVLVFNLSLWKISAVIWTCYLKLNKILYILHLIRICTIIHIQFILTLLDICKKKYVGIYKRSWFSFTGYIYIQLFFSLYVNIFKCL